MKAALPLVSLIALAACVPSAKAPPAPAPTPVARPVPQPAPPQPPVMQQPRPSNWMDAPLSQGRWRYQSGFDNSFALFGNNGATALVLWCDRQTRGIGIDRAVMSAVSQPPAVTIRTETVSQRLPLMSVRDGSLTAQFSANDPLLDAMALSKGRFAVEVEGEAPLYLPSHAEVSRVIEDCR